MTPPLPHYFFGSLQTFPYTRLSLPGLIMSTPTFKTILNLHMALNMPYS